MGLILPLGLLGLIVGMAIVSVAMSYGADRHVWPWPRDRMCGYAPSPRAGCACARSVVHPRHAARGRTPLQGALWIPVATATVFGGLGLRYAAEPALLVVSVVEATLLLLLLVIDLKVRLVPTPLVGLLAAVALATANLWPGLGLCDALLGGAIGCASFAALGGLARLLYGAGAFGLGDTLLALVVGCITGYPLVVATLALGVILGGVGALVVLLVHGGTRRSVVAYGPYVISGLLVMVIHGNTLHPRWIPW